MTGPYCVFCNLDDINGYVQKGSIFELPEHAYTGLFSGHTCFSTEQPEQDVHTTLREEPFLAIAVVQQNSAQQLEYFALKLVHFVQDTEELMRF